MVWRWPSLVIVLLACVVACGGDDADHAGAAASAGADRVPCKVAAVLERRCVRCHGTVLHHGAPIALDGFTRLFPTAEAIAEHGREVLRGPAKRIDAIVGAAQALAEGSLSIDVGESRADLEARLLALPGIGPWTVEYVAMRAWRDADAWPASDLVLMQAISARDPSLVRPTQQRSRTDAWRPWRAYAAMHLWSEVADRAGAARGG